MEDNGLHPVVDLLISRMKSHPEEFHIGLDADSPYAVRVQPIGSRWATIISRVEQYASEEELTALRDAMRHIMLDEAHEKALDELLNGPERRAEEEKERQRSYTTMQQAVMAQQAYRGAQNSLVGVHNPLAGTAISTAVTPGTSVVTPPTLQIGNETLDAGMISQIKRKLGL